MRQIFRLIGNRYGAAFVVVFVIAVVVGFGKLLGGTAPHTSSGYDPGQADPGSAAGVDVSPIPDDGDVGPSGSPAPPSISPGAASAQAVALSFAQAWLRHVGVTPQDWHARLSRYTTKSLAERLNGVDPAGVPANSTTGDVTIIDQDPAYVDIAIPLDAGTLSLRVIPVNGRWLVDGVDWQRT
jgi:hypothetical protein